MKKEIIYFLFLFSFFSFCFFFSSFSITPSYSETKEELERRINEQKQKIQELDKQIENNLQSIEKVSKEADSLQKAVSELNLTEKNINTKIKKTEGEINSTELTIEKINLDIGETEQRISFHREAIAQSLREVRDLEQTSIIEIILGSQKISNLFSAIDKHSTVRQKIFDRIDQLEESKVNLAQNQSEKEKEKINLKSLNQTLSGQKESVAETKKEKNNLLAETKNSELTYKQMLEEKLQQKKLFEQALVEFESQLDTIVNPSSITKAFRGLIGWPLPKIRITQEFGGTQFAKNNPGIYDRGFHNGVDFGIPMGTNVFSVADGEVIGTGNTDAYWGCYSWGKWILIRHSKLKLVTLYAHLSSIGVSPGETVSRGQVIGLSGSSGISTGPHLHFTLYSDQGVELRKIREFYPGTKCLDLEIPIAPTEAYLDPMRYLPEF